MKTSSKLALCALLLASCDDRQAAPTVSASSTTTVQTSDGATTIQLGMGTGSVTIEVEPGVTPGSSNSNVVVNGNGKTVTTVNGLDFRIEADQLLVGGKSCGAVHAGSRVRVTSAGVVIDGRAPLPLR